MVETLRGPRDTTPSLADLGGYLGSCTHGFRRQRCWLPPLFCLAPGLARYLECKKHDKTYK